MELEVLYTILADIARTQNIITYGQLSQEYCDRTGEWHEPHGTWDEPLGELNRLVYRFGWPAISSVVVLQDSHEPGGKYWGSSPNVPARPSNQVARIALYGQLLSAVHAAPWPVTIPTAPPC
jgi:hypothetical protein